MNLLQQLADEATDLNHHDAVSGLVNVTSFGIGQWEVTVHINNQCALHHADDPDAAHPTMHEYGRDLDTVLARMLSRVRDAVADTPAWKVA